MAIGKSNPSVTLDDILSKTTEAAQEIVDA